MGNHFTLDDETFILAEQLASLKGETVERALLSAVREQLTRELEVQAEAVRMRTIAAEFRAGLEDPLPSSDHGWLYDDLYEDESRPIR